MSPTTTVVPAPSGPDVVVDLPIDGGGHSAMVHVPADLLSELAPDQLAIATLRPGPEWPAYPNQLWGGCGHDSAPAQSRLGQGSGPCAMALRVPSIRPGRPGAEWPAAKVLRDVAPDPACFE